MENVVRFSYGLKAHHRNIVPIGSALWLDHRYSLRHLMYMDHVMVCLSWHRPGVIQAPIPMAYTTPEKLVHWWSIHHQGVFLPLSGKIILFNGNLFIKISLYKLTSSTAPFIRNLFKPFKKSIGTTLFVQIQNQTMLHLRNILNHII